MGLEEDEPRPVPVQRRTSVHKTERPINVVSDSDISDSDNSDSDSIDRLFVDLNQQAPEFFPKHVDLDPIGIDRNIGQQTDLSDRDEGNEDEQDQLELPVLGDISNTVNVTDHTDDTDVDEAHVDEHMEEVILDPGSPEILVESEGENLVQEDLEENVAGSPVSIQNTSRPVPRPDKTPIPVPRPRRNRRPPEWVRSGDYVVGNFSQQVNSVEVIGRVLETYSETVKDVLSRLNSNFY